MTDPFIDADQPASIQHPKRHGHMEQMCRVLNFKKLLRRMTGGFTLQAIRKSNHEGSCNQPKLNQI
jgi:hypothetical protein